MLGAHRGGSGQCAINPIWKMVCTSFCLIPPWTILLLWQYTEVKCFKTRHNPFQPSVHWWTIFQQSRMSETVSLIIKPNRTKSSCSIDIFLLQMKKYLRFDPRPRKVMDLAAQSIIGCKSQLQIGHWCQLFPFEKGSFQIELQSVRS